MIPSPAAVAKWFSQILPRPLRPLFSALTHIVGWILFLQAALSLIAGRDVVRDFFVWLVQISPEIVAKALTGVGNVAMMLVTAWRSVTQPTLAIIADALGIRVPDWALDAAIVVLFFVGALARTIVLSLRSEHAADEAEERKRQFLERNFDPEDMTDDEMDLVKRARFQFHVEQRATQIRLSKERFAVILISAVVIFLLLGNIVYSMHK